jgi:hypothetical protein
LPQTKTSKNYEGLKRELKSLTTELGFLLTGTVQSRYFECGTTVHCRCHESPANRHGPYHYWTRKVKGKTVNVSLSNEQAALFREWMENSRALDGLLKKMRRESMRAIALAAQKTAKSKTG